MKVTPKKNPKPKPRRRKPVRNSFDDEEFEDWMVGNPSSEETK